MAGARRGGSAGGRPAASDAGARPAPSNLGVAPHRAAAWASEVRRRPRAASFDSGRWASLEQKGSVERLGRTRVQGVRCSRRRPSLGVNEARYYGPGLPRCCDRVAGCEVRSSTFQTPVSCDCGCPTSFLIFPLTPPTGEHLGVGLHDSPNSSTSIFFGCTPTTVLGVPAFFRVNQHASVKTRSLGAASPVRPSLVRCPGLVWSRALPAPWDACYFQEH